MTESQRDRVFAEALALAIEKARAESTEVLVQNLAKQAVFKELNAYFASFGGEFADTQIAENSGFTVKRCF